ncbi:MAG TPA: ABC transporter substrate-binding protein [Gemmatimonadaceae bacterium]|nr:ABC transporter substrate-binding protein [Gemmatimonadaceae bacterium]
MNHRACPRRPRPRSVLHRSLRCGVVLALIACGGASEARRGADEARNGGTLRIPLINDPILDPVIAPDIGSVMVNKVLFPGLVRPDEQLRPTPDLAESWVTSEDGLRITFKLRRGVTWHDGAPFSAHDVKFTFDQVVDLASGSRLRSDFAALAGVDVEDSLTVTFRLRAPFAPFLTLLGYNAGILPKHLLQGKPLTAATNFNRRHPVGTGPFMVQEVVPGASLTLVRNPRYHGEAPRLDRILFKVVPDLNAQVAQLRAGELDLVTIEPSNLASVQGARGVEVLQVPVVQHYYVAFNLRKSRFRPAEVRRALGMAVNREAIIKGVLRDYADMPRGTIPVALEAYFADSLPPIPYAPDSALLLLQRAGWRRGHDGTLRDARGTPFDIELLVDKGNPTREQSALSVQQDLQKIGIRVSIRTMEFAALVRDRILPGTFDATLIWWTTPPDPDQYAFYHSGQDNNNVQWSNPLADSLLALGRITLDPAKRREIYHAFQRIEMEDPPVLVLFYPREIQAVSARLEGLPSLGIRDALRYSERLAKRAR